MENDQNQEIENKNRGSGITKFFLTIIQIVGLLLGSAAISLNGFGPTQQGTNIIIILFTVTAFLPLPFWNYIGKKRLVFNFCISGFIVIMFFLFTINGVIYSVKEKARIKNFNAQNTNFTQDNNKKLADLIKEPILITDFNNKNIPVLMTDKGFAIYLHPEAQNYDAFIKFIQINIINQKVIVVLQGANNVVGQNPRQSGAFNPENNFGTSRPFPNAEFGCYCDIKINGQLLNEMQFPN